MGNANMPAVTINTQKVPSPDAFVLSPEESEATGGAVGGKEGIFSSSGHFSYVSNGQQWSAVLAEKTHVMVLS